MADRTGMSTGQTYDDLPSTAGMEVGYEDESGLFGETNILNLEEQQEGVESGFTNPETQSGSPKRNFSGDPELDDGEKLVDEADLSPDGVLDEETIERGLANLGRSAHGTQQVFLDLTLAGYCLRDISVLTEYVHIQKVELPYNELTDLSPLVMMPFLVELDVSHNKLESMNDFKLLKSIKYADLSFNEITEIVDLSEHTYLSSLKLDKNHIERIQGLENCSRLKDLSLGHNQIQEISGLDGLPITRLNLQYNQLNKIANLGSLNLLIHINLAGNQIMSLAGLDGHEFIESVDVENNQILEIQELDHVFDLHLLRDLNLKQNPIQEMPDYRLSVLFRLQKLTELDRAKVEAEEKVAAINLFNPSREVIAARDHIMHVVYSFLQPGKVMDSTLPSLSTPYPMLVLVGPEGSGKTDLAMKLVAEFPEFFGYGVTLTTRKPHPHEVPDKHYHFMSLEEFEDEIRYGQFFYTYNYGGYWYGLTKECVESVARDGLACVVQMELEGVLTLKNTHFEPRYVFIMPSEQTSHEQRLRARQLYNDSEVDLALSRAQIYLEQNVTSAGFFDAYVDSTDITQAYVNLRRLVLEYLGVANQYPDTVTSDQPANQDPPQSAGVAEIAKPWSRAGGKSSGDSQVVTSETPLMTSQADVVKDVGSVEEASIQRRQSAAREALFDCERPRTHDVVIHRATRSCIDRIRTSATPGEEPYTDSSSASTRSDTFSESADPAPQNQAPHTPNQGPHNPNQGSPSSNQGLHTPRNTPQGGTPQKRSPQGSPQKGSPEGSPEKPSPAPSEERGTPRPGAEKHPVLPPIQSPVPPV